MLTCNRPRANRRASRLRCVLAGAAIFGLSGSQFTMAQSAEKAEAIEPEAIGAVVSCTVCHGVDGEGNAQLGAPRIGGMKEWYVARQLRHFRQGVRGGTDEDPYGIQMHAITLAVDSMEVLDELAAYWSSLMPPPAPTSISGDAARGEQLYQVCTACHGRDGRGSKELNTPSLVDQFDWYLVRQLENYSEGVRGTNDADPYGMQMVPIMKTLPERQDIIDVVTYINTL
jgi:cytochrome c oxidase subunit 2